MVAGGYGYGNMGDEAQCAATLQMLSLRYPGFQIRDLTPDTDYSLGAHPGFAHDYASRVEIFNQGRPHDAFRVKTLMRRIRFRLLSALMLLNARLARRGWPLLMLNAARASFLRQIERASLFFFCGGGYLTGSTRSRLWDGALVCRLCANVSLPRREVETVDEPCSVNVIARPNDRIDARFLNPAFCSRLHRLRRPCVVSS